MKYISHLVTIFVILFFGWCKAATNQDAVLCNIVASFPLESIDSWICSGSSPVTDPCVWAGVFCSATADIVKLNLSSFSVSGTVSPYFGEMNALTSLILGNNLFSGQIPSSLGDLSSLVELELSSNFLTGPVPSEIGSLLTLTLLKLDANLFSGSFTESNFASTLYNLESFDLEYNLFHGSMYDLTGFSKLTLLSLGDNSFTGNIPTSVGSLTNLEYLSLSNNKITGSIPDEIRLMVSIQQFWLNGNLLTGRMDTNVFNSLVELQAFHIQNNLITWVFPFSISNCVKLASVNVSHNNMKGELPFAFLLLTELILLDVSDNSFSGTIPPMSLPNLHTFRANSNRFTGTVPSSLCSSDHLSELYMADVEFECYERCLTQAIQSTTFSPTVPKCAPKPTATPTTPYPSAAPSSMPSMSPTEKAALVFKPTPAPTPVPSASPTKVPTALPTTPHPTAVPTISISSTSKPTDQPSGQPSSSPSLDPSSAPSNIPSNTPTVEPSSAPSVEPTSAPTVVYVAPMTFTLGEYISGDTNPFGVVAVLCTIIFYLFGTVDESWELAAKQKERKLKSKEDKKEQKRLKLAELQAAMNSEFPQKLSVDCGHGYTSTPEVSPLPVSPRNNAFCPVHPSLKALAPPMPPHDYRAGDHDAFHELPSSPPRVSRTENGRYVLEEQWSDPMYSDIYQTPPQLEIEHNNNNMNRSYGNRNNRSQGRYESRVNSTRGSMHSSNRGSPYGGTPSVHRKKSARHAMEYEDYPMEYQMVDYQQAPQVVSMEDEPRYGSGGSRRSSRPESRHLSSENTPRASRSGSRSRYANERSPEDEWNALYRRSSRSRSSTGGGDESVPMDRREASEKGRRRSYSTSTRPEVQGEWIPIVVEPRVEPLFDNRRGSHSTSHVVRHGTSGGNSRASSRASPAGNQRRSQSTKGGY